jgi:hypothetical protein
MRRTGRITPEIDKTSKSIDIRLGLDGEETVIVPVSFTGVKCLFDRFRIPAFDICVSL